MVTKLDVDNKFLNIHNRILNTKAYFKKCPVIERQRFKQSSCIIPISVGQQLEVHEGEKFAATLEIVNASFKRCTLLIDDTVQRHTMRIFSSASEDVLYKEALLEGDDWLERNATILQNLNIEYNISRWSDWLNHPNYLSQHEIVTELYNKDHQYKQSIDTSINEYITRVLKRRLIKFDLELAFNCCLKYLLEECTIMCLWSQENYDFELYPSGRNQAMKATYEHIIKLNNYSGKLVSVSLYFRKKHGVDIQKLKV